MTLHREAIRQRQPDVYDISRYDDPLPSPSRRLSGNEDIYDLALLLILGTS